VRDPAQQPPFSSTDGGHTWQRNYCDPASTVTCQGAYEGCGENYGKAFAILGGDAKPNVGSSDPRSLVHLDYRYDALVDFGYWHYLQASDAWSHDVPPAGKKGDMASVISLGGYSKQPLPRAVDEPPPAYHPDGWGYCWAEPANENNCFNYPAADRGIPYDVLEFLSGTDAAAEAKRMYDDGNYVRGRFAPGERIVIMVYNGVAGDQWGTPGKLDDAAAVVGYFGAVIVGYGTDLETPDDGGTRCIGTPGQYETYRHCIKQNPSGQANTVYAIATAPLLIDPETYIEEFLPRQILLIR